MITPVMPTYARADIEMVRGEGCYMFDSKGRKYLDFAAGIAVNAFGHGHPHLVEALKRQADLLWHTSNLYRLPGQERVSQRLREATFADTMFFTNSGTEAVECAIKTCRRHHAAQGRPEKYGIITFSNAFHGRTLGAISATDQVKLRDGFEPLLQGFTVVPFNDLAAVEAAITPNIGGIMLEPVQGEGGITPASQEFMKGLRALCDKHELLLILDEIQCGVGRTGTLFAYEQYGIEPDIMAVAKGIGGGFPVGACLATEYAASGMVVGTHGSTYGGNPLAMAVADAVLDLVLEPGLMEHVRQMGERLAQALQQMAPNHPGIFADEPVRGLGLMRGIKCLVPSRDLANHARSEGILTVAGGQDVLRLLPPLNIEQAHIDEAVERLSAAARSFPKD